MFSNDLCLSKAIQNYVKRSQFYMASKFFSREYETMTQAPFKMRKKNQIRKGLPKREPRGFTLHLDFFQFTFSAVKIRLFSEI